MLNKLEKFSLPEIEEKVLNFWRKNDIFNKSLLKNKNKKEFVFYEGPPTANGRPGIHHVLSRAFKDIVLRYKTMVGYFVPRRAGWDTHGLPVEIEVEKKLGLKTKKDIENYGISKFNLMCKESVWQYKDEWEKLTERMGFWLDLKNPYITYKNDYIEILWQIIKKIFQKKLFYLGYKVVPWCSRCGTSLSSHEIALGYKSVKDLSVYLKFKLKNKNEYILSWTTTPWTLPGNVALAVNPNLDYVKVNYQNEIFILAKSRLNILENKYKILQTFKGKDLLGLSYEPLFEIEALNKDTSYKIYPADFVSSEDGTGVVHTAVMYGEEDYELGKKYDLVQFHTVDEDGLFNKEVKEFKGLYVKDKLTEEKIINYLREKNFLFKTEEYEHDYPFCWRCQTPILYYARNSWFVKMSVLKDKLIKENQKINWVPSHLKEGRFGEWLKEIKDWNFSRERYWGTPLPIWQCENCRNLKVIDKISDLDKFNYASSSNVYYLLRHGEAESNLKKIISCELENDNFKLTLKGRIQIEKLAKKLKNEKIDVIFASDFLRTRQTAEILKDYLNLEINFDSRLREIYLKKLNGKDSDKFFDFIQENYQNELEMFSKKIEGIESLNELSSRIFSFIKSCEEKYQNKRILIVSHEYPLWLFESILNGLDEEKTIFLKNLRKGEIIKNGELKIFKFKNLPRNEFGMLDLHRPYIDEIKLKCEKCAGEMKRIKEIADVWFDSGAMPFGSKAKYPADYIAEGIDQTRGWFYTLLAVGVLMSKGRSYKNVISLGHVLDKNGQKMSKSKGNVVDPWLMISKYGIDSVRWYFYTINNCGEPKKFDENDLLKVLRQFILLIYNSFTFYDLYKIDKLILDKWPAKRFLNVLDVWILTRLNYLIKAVTLSLNKYEIDKAARLIEEFVYDLSRWYIRRSRKRFQKPLNKEELAIVSQVLGFVLLNLAKLIAPFMPFLAEALYQSLKIKNKKLSVHLENWPKFNNNFKDKKILEKMEALRNLASLVLAERAKNKIKVRQPLSDLKIKNKNIFEKGLIEVLKEEINVKEIIFEPKLETDFKLNTEITHQLKEEGYLRELIRIIQDFRQDLKLKPKEKIYLGIETNSKELRFLIEKNLAFLKKEINVFEISFNRLKNFENEFETKLEDFDLTLTLKK